MNKLSINIHSRFGSQYWQYRVRLKDGTIIRKSTGIKKSYDKSIVYGLIKEQYKDKIKSRKSCSKQHITKCH